MSGTIYQLLPTLAVGDAIGNEVLSIDAGLRARGVKTHIYYLQNPRGSIDSRIASPYEQMPETTDEDIILYHLSIGSRMNRDLRGVKGKIIFRYHNITPADFFRYYNPELEDRCRKGLEEIRSLADMPDRCIAVSEFNKAHLRSLGYTCAIDTCPIVINWKEYDDVAGAADADAAPIAKKADKSDPLRVLFVGRVAPNKKHQDLIAAVAAYVESYGPGIDLTLIGSSAGNGGYEKELRAYADLLGIADRVHFCGHMDFAGIVQAYRSSDIFLCLSEHEGFCVPLIEAMHFGVPIVAYDAAAVGNTLGDAGILLRDKTPERVAEALHRLTDPDERERYRQAEARRVQDFDPEKTLDRLLSCLC